MLVMLFIVEEKFVPLGFGFVGALGFILAGKWEGEKYKKNHLLNYIFGHSMLPVQMFSRYWPVSR